MREAGKKQLETLRRTIDAEIPSKTLLRVGSPQVEIINAAKESGIDVIILSTHGRTGLAHVFLGSTAERVVRHAGCPVLIVREEEHEFVASRPGKAGG
jgi:nucleotide-binding universal stress UspA family protein